MLLVGAGAPNGFKGAVKGFTAGLGIALGGAAVVVFASCLVSSLGGAAITLLLVMTFHS